MPPTDDTMWTEDRAARELLTFPRVVAGFLTELLPETAAQFDFDKMQIRPTVTLDSSGKERIADSSWEIALKDGRVVGIPIEWQSTPDANMLWRMIEYATRLGTLMSRQSRLGHPEGSTPYVFPIVIYTGGPRGTWSAPTEWRHQPADEPDQFPPRHLAFGYPLICADDAKEYAGDDPRTARTHADDHCGYGGDGDDGGVSEVAAPTRRRGRRQPGLGGGRLEVLQGDRREEVAGIGDREAACTHQHLARR